MHGVHYSNVYVGTPIILKHVRVALLTILYNYIAQTITA